MLTAFPVGAVFLYHTKLSAMPWRKAKGLTMVFPKTEINRKDNNWSGGKRPKDAMNTHKKKEQNYTVKEEKAQACREWQKVCKCR